MGSVDVENLLNFREAKPAGHFAKYTNIAVFTPVIAGMRADEFGTTQFAFGGMQRRAFQGVDGANNTQRGGQPRLGIFNLESISEVQVIANAYSAEYRLWEAS